MTKRKGLYRNKFERPEPVLYDVYFESGYIERVMAKSRYEARQKTLHLCSYYGFITNARTH